MTDQQHAIDQARQDTTAAVTTGLTEIRAVVRDGLNRGTDTLRDPLATISTELVAIRAAINNVQRDRPAAERPPAPSAPPPEPAAHTRPDDRGEHAGLGTTRHTPRVDPGTAAIAEHLDDDAS
ncbi:hypothetical protein ABT390_09335 [Streptomyces aurantiacus]|uniref:Uncharacterized protein n=1 Tax=Streptomyces aurantiacus JA 4570 TaxID=1286094 RepID=S3ZTN4_9ACTN|nr:hypothetical protein [Streptomyces aurantiacus]EPH46124.1 hypothetical protein STRAU_0860 [Streptomyces aurantiacus JA 4570]